MIILVDSQANAANLACMMCRCLTQSQNTLFLAELYTQAWHTDVLGNQSAYETISEELFSKSACMWL